MHLQKGLVLGILAALVLGILVSAAAASLSRRVDDSPLTVPASRVGDKVAYSHFERESLWWIENAIEKEGIADWKHKGVFAFHGESLARTSDRAGVVHDTFRVFSNGTIGSGTFAEYVDLTTRDAIRFDAKYAGESGSPTKDLAISMFTIAPSGVPGILLQGRTLRLGEQLPTPRTPDEGGSFGWSLSTSGAPSLYGPRFHLDVSVTAEEPKKTTGGAGSTTRTWVAERALIEGRDAYGVRTEVSMPLRASDAAAEDDVMQRFIGGSLRFAYTEWMADDVPYPVLLDAEFGASDASGHFTAFTSQRATLIEYTSGTTPVPWGQDAGTDHYRESNRDAERTPGAQVHPADGTGSRLAYKLSRAVDDVRNDQRLLRFQLWRIQHPDAVLVSAEARPGEQSTSTQPTTIWHLVFAVPSGAAFEVSAERVPADAVPAVTQERGERTVTPFAITDFPANPVTAGTGEVLWSTSAGGPYPGRAPNFVHWGYRLAYEDGPTCGLQWTNWGYVNDPRTELRTLVVGYSSIGSCLESSTTAEQSAAVVRTESGNLVGLYQVLLDFDYLAFPATSKADLPGVAPKTVPAGLQPPEPEKAVIASSSFLVVFLVAYFFPLLKFAAAHVLVVVPGYTKLLRSELLGNEIRDQLLDAIKSNPGIHASELARRIDAGWGTIVYHLHVLERNKLVSSLVDGRNRRFFPVGTIDWSRRGQIAVLRNETAKALYDLITQDPGVIQGDLARRINLSVPSAIWHLRRLEDAGLVGRDKKGRKVHYYPNEAPPDLAPYDPKDAVEVT